MIVKRVRMEIDWTYKEVQNLDGLDGVFIGLIKEFGSNRHKVKMKLLGGQLDRLIFPYEETNQNNNKIK